MAAETYIIDTNALVGLANRNIREPIIAHFDELTIARRLLTVNIVFDELKRTFNPVYLIFKRYKQAMVVKHRDDIEILRYSRKLWMR